VPLQGAGEVIAGELATPSLRQVVDFVRSEAARPVGHERDHVIDGMYAGDRQRQIVGAAALPQLEQHIEIEMIIGEVEAEAGVG
jgi:hypothetical protein